MTFKITPEVCIQAEMLAAKGLILPQIAKCLGICEKTLHVKKNSNIQFLQAIEAGRARGIREVTNALYERAIVGDMTAIKYFLNNRDSDNWKDKQHTELSGGVGLHEQFIENYSK